MIVADISDPFYINHIEIVDKLLAEIGVVNKEAILVLNKSDRLEAANTQKIKDDRETVFISAKEKKGLEELKQLLSQKTNKKNIRMSILVPFSEGWVLPYVYECGKVISKDYKETGTLMDVEIEKGYDKKLMEFLIEV